MASIITRNSKMQMSTVRPGVMKALEPDRRWSGELIQHNPTVTENDFGAKIISTESIGGTAELRTAEVIVSGGRGLQTKEHYDQYIYPLAES